MVARAHDLRARVGQDAERRPDKFVRRQPDRNVVQADGVRARRGRIAADRLQRQVVVIRTRRREERHHVADLAHLAESEELVEGNRALELAHAEYDVPDLLWLDIVLRRSGSRRLGHHASLGSLPRVRRGTAITLIVLFVVLIVTAVIQFTLASGDRAPLPGPASVGQIPSPPPTP
jgi:hypothetical protein